MHIFPGKAILFDYLKKYLSILLNESGVCAKNGKDK